MKYLSTTLVLVCLTLNSIMSQTETKVKRQYIEAETTVVVKENNASDLDVLASQFNLNDVGMGEVIFIKTENLQPAKPKAERTSFSQMVKESSKPARTVASEPTIEKPVAKAAISKPKFKAIPNTPKRKVAKKTVKPKIKKPQKYFGVGSARKIKTKKKKLKKRKRVRRSSRKKCFSF